MLRLEVVTDERRAWDAFVGEAERSTHAHLSGWLDVNRLTFGHEATLIVATDELGNWLAGIPLIHVRSVLFGSRTVSMPYLNYGGPVGEPAACAFLLNQLNEGRIPSVPGGTVLRCKEPLDVPVQPNITKLTVVRELPDTADELMKQFDSKLRSQIRKAQRENAEVQFGNQHLEPFYEVFKRHMRDLGTPVMPLRFFEEIIRQFGEEVRIGVIYSEGLPIAAGFGFRWKSTFEITWASALVEFKRTAPNMQLYWGMLANCIAEGVREFDFGRCTPGSGTHKFKMQWGGRELPLHWYNVGGAVSPPTKESKVFRVATQLWKRIPLSLATRIGPSIVRGIP